MKLKFGKFKGQELGEVPLSYLAWLHDEADWIDDDLYWAVKAEIDARIHPDGTPQAKPTEPLDPATLNAARVLIRVGFRTASKAAHPDVEGGSHAAMLALTQARDWLDRVVGEGRD